MVTFICPFSPSTYIATLFRPCTELFTRSPWVSTKVPFCVSLEEGPPSNVLVVTLFRELSLRLPILPKARKIQTYLFTLLTFCIFVCVSVVMWVIGFIKIYVYDNNTVCYRLNRSPNIGQQCLTTENNKDDL